MLQVLQVLRLIPRKAVKLLVTEGLQVVEVTFVQSFLQLLWLLETPKSELAAFYCKLVDSGKKRW
jgi:hypothetical protein